VLLLDCLLDSDLFITSVFADSGDEDDNSPTENLPKRDKGKGRAVYTGNEEETENLPKKAKGKHRPVYNEYLEQEEFDLNYAQELQEQEDSYFENTLNLQEQEKSDFEFAKELQKKSDFEFGKKQLDEEYKSSLPYNPSNEVASKADAVKSESD